MKPKTDTPPGMLADVPDDLHAGPVRLTFARIVAPSAGHPGLVPCYHFRISRTDGCDVGHINFRVGDTPHVTRCAGHVGFAVDAPHRGHSYAYFACHALASFIRRHYERVILTANPDSTASLQTIRRLGARFVDRIAVPPDDPAYTGGARTKLRYEWRP